LNIRLGLATEVDVAGSLSIAVGTHPARDWRRRWEILQEDLVELETPRSGELSGRAIHAAAQQLQSFYIQLYHLKDALKLEPGSHGVSRQTIEAAVSAEPELSLLADLANLDKHVNLRNTRSGAVPHVTAVRGVRAGSGEGGWRLEVEISHAGRSLDGLEVARAALAAWERQLATWGLT
jgi:hypothetical protein